MADTPESTPPLIASSTRAPRRGGWWMERNSPRMALLRHVLLDDADVLGRRLPEVAVGIVLHHELPFLERLAEDLRLGEGEPEVVVSLGAVGVDGEGFLVLRHRVAQVPAHVRE